VPAITQPEITTSTPTTVPDPTAPPTAPPEVTEWILPVASEVPDTWTEAFVIPYGGAVDLLGSAPGGEGLTLGPEYGAQAPDATWWILDSAKRRLAHVDEIGRFLDAVAVPTSMLAHGTYFQYQLPRVLADGTVVAQRLGSNSTDLLELRSGTLRIVTVPGLFVTRADDGTRLFGFDDASNLMSVDPSSGRLAEVDWFRTQTGARYRIDVVDSGLRIQLPDTGVDETVAIAGSNGQGKVHPSLEIATGIDGAIHLLVLGINESAESTQLAGYATIAPDGTLSPIEGMRDPFSVADPGSPIRDATTRPRRRDDPGVR
jgi:hypothetical protein